MADETYSAQELEQALAELHDIYLPLPEDTWSLSQNAVTTIVLVVLVAIGAGLMRRYFSRSPRHLALKEFESIRLAHRRGASPQATMSACATVVRRLALALYPTAEIAGLTGTPWLEFLERTSGPSSGRDADGSSFFSDGDGSVLGSGPFRRSAPPFDSDDLLTGLEQWVRNVTTPHLNWREKLIHPPQGLPQLYP